MTDGTVASPSALIEFCVELARDFEPNATSRDVYGELARLASPWQSRELGVLSPRRQAEELAMIVFGLSGFAAGRIEEPSDFLLPRVLRTRKGRPALLGVVYQEIARLLGVRVEPISSPNQALLRVIDTQRPGGLDRAVLVDPARNGEILDVEEFLIAGDEAWLEALPFAIWQRQLLDEFRQLLVRRREYGAALLVVHRHCAIEPTNPVVFRERGLLHRRLGAPISAVEDLEMYLALAPHASDVQDVAETVDEIRDAIHRAPHRFAN